MTTLKKRVGDVAQQRFKSDPKLSLMTMDAIYKELMEEMDRYPVVDRVAEELQLLSDPSFTENIRSSVQTILLEHKRQQPLPQTDANEGSEIVSATPSTNRPSVEPASGPSVVVTPATPFDAINNSTVPPPITTQEEPPEQALEGDLETENKATDPTDGPSKLSILTTSGADVDMAEESLVREGTITSQS
ncbi:hypothetical protein C0991_009663 [Blastosporella zonata]|nr:hypothetical protein C0991_009663 [Blastosporella zonata]